jgi:hypothetical protein
MYIFAYKLLALVPQQHAGQQTGLTEDLKTVTYPKHETATGSEIGYGLHDRRKTCDSSCAQIIAKGKPSRQDDAIAQPKASQIRIFMPEANGLLSEYSTQDMYHIVVAIRTGKDNHSKFHILLVLGSGYELSLVRQIM